MTEGCAEAMGIFEAKTCALNGACHDANGSAAAFKMTGTGWEKQLVGVSPKGGGALVSMCMTAGMPYLVKGTQPATGLFLNKLKAASPVCGDQMPTLGDKLTATEMNCIQRWADKLVKDTPP